MELLGEIVAWLADPANWEGRFGLPSLLRDHLLYSAGGTALAIAFALPLGLWVGHSRRFTFAVTAVTNLGRAVPDLGVIVIAFLLVGRNIVPILVTLAALAVPPIFVNTTVGIRQAAPDAVEAAAGMGLTGSQVLRKVELPLAVPVIMAGIRTAAVQVVATATLAGYLGLGGLGRWIFDGFAVGFTAARARVLVAAALVAVLAVATELALSRLERRLTPAGTT